jgi:hypothetical protein
VLRSHSRPALRRRRINIADDNGLQFWLRKFSVSAEELYSAMMAVGSAARFVDEYLRDTQRSRISKMPE